ncbi:YdcH family protein [Neptunomonas sp.]|uniref:YdcH family protein n=1 Tax=Neptunomonas sp. TaxID=1971898 RepID=UPI003564BB6E
MSIEHHDLVHELPEYREQIHTLKMNDAHFAKLFDEYHDVTKKVERMETEAEPVATRTEEELKVKRLHLKDQLYAMLRATA